MVLNQFQESVFLISKWENKLTILTHCHYRHVWYDFKNVIGREEEKEKKGDNNNKLVFLNGTSRFIQVLSLTARDNCHHVSHALSTR